MPFLLLVIRGVQTIGFIYKSTVPIMNYRSITVKFKLTDV